MCILVPEITIFPSTPTLNNKKKHKTTIIAEKMKQEGHDGPEVAHLYIGPPPGAGPI
jgi:hypothetical protein